MRRKFYQEVGVKQGSEITLNYRLTNINQGNQFKRWFLAGMMENPGEGTIIVEVTYIDQNNNVLGKINTEGKTEQGLFGGTFSNAIDAAVNQIVRFTLQSFRPNIIRD